MVELRLKLSQPGAHVFILNHYTLAASQLRHAAKGKLIQAVTGQLMKKLKGKISTALSHGYIQRPRGDLHGKGPGRTKDSQGKQVLFSRQLTTSPA